MSLLFGTTPTLLLAVCLLVLVGSLPAVPALPRLRGPLAPLFALLTLMGATAAIWLGLERPGSLLDDFPGRIVKYAAEELNAATEPTVLILDGGSYVINGVDCNDLMKELGNLGHPTHAIRIGAGAANHFERYRMQQRVVERLRAKNPQQRWVFFAEVQRGYDNAPLAQFGENPDTPRVYDYSTLPNAWYAAAALRTPNVKVPPEWRWALLRSTLVNSFNAGAFMRLSDESEVELGGGRVAPRKISKVKLGQRIQEQIASLKEPPRAEDYPWVTRIRERRILDLWEPFISEFGYFGVPSTGLEQLGYIRKFCSETRHPCVSPDDKLLAELDSPTCWRDGVHMSKKGATIYTRWLAQQLVAQKIVR